MLRYLALIILPLSLLAEPAIQIVGLKEEALFAMKGTPDNVLRGPTKAIYQWADMEVTVVDKTVVAFKHRTPKPPEPKVVRVEVPAVTSNLQATASTSTPPPVAKPNEDSRTAEIRQRMEKQKARLDMVQEQAQLKANLAWADETSKMSEQERIAQKRELPPPEAIEWAKTRLEYLDLVLSKTPKE